MPITVLHLFIWGLLLLLLVFKKYIKGREITLIGAMGNGRI